MPTYAVPSTDKVSKEATDLASLVSRISQASTTAAAAVRPAASPLADNESGCEAASLLLSIGASTSTTASAPLSNDELAIRLEFVKLHNPELFKAINAALRYDEVQQISFRPTWSGVYSVSIAMLIFSIMFFEYFFSAQAQINDKTTATVSSVVSVLLNTALTTYVLRGFIDASIFNTISLFAQLGRTIYSRSTQPIADIIDYNLPYAWSADGRRVLCDHRSSAGYAFEMIKPLISLTLQAGGFLGAYVLSVILFQNSENAYRRALAVKPWLSKFFTIDMYEQGPFLGLNYAELGTTTPLNALEHAAKTREVIDTTPSSATSKQRLRDFCSLFNIFATGYETRTAADKIDYILHNLGQAQKKQLKKQITEWLTQPSMLGSGTNIDQSRKDGLEVGLKNHCASILKPIDSNPIFKLGFLTFLATSITATVYYCIGIKHLFMEAAANPLLPFGTAALLKFFRADTDVGALIISAFAVGIFATSYGAMGLARPLRDSAIRMYHQNGMLNKILVFMAAVATLGFAGLSGSTAAFESSGGAVDVYTVMGGIKGSSVNAVGAYAFSLFIATGICQLLVWMVDAIKRACSSCCTCLPFCRSGSDDAAHSDATANAPLLPMLARDAT